MNEWPDELAASAYVPTSTLSLEPGSPWLPAAEWHSPAAHALTDAVIRYAAGIGTGILLGDWDEADAAVVEMRAAMTWLGHEHLAQTSGAVNELDYYREDGA